jgi:hypothetical protein
MATELPSSVCFRVTRYCNAHCGFCLAPPEGVHPPAQVLLQRLDVRWLDFATRAVPVVEVDGRLILEGASETHDRVLAQIPGAIFSPHLSDRGSAPDVSFAPWRWPILPERAAR